MAGISYEVKIGSFQASSRPGKGNGQVRSLSCELTMEGAGGHCYLELAATGTALPKPGDKTTITLDDGNGGATVFTGEVQETKAAPDLAIVLGADGLAKLARLDLEGAYEQMSAGAIAKELVRKAGATAGKIEDGPKFPSYVLHRGPRALRHLQRLAEQCGFDVYTDGDGKVHFAAPKQGGADHTFTYRKQVLRTGLERVQPAYDGVQVWGEGAASTKGSDKAHWLLTDLASVSGKASMDGNATVKPGSAGKLMREVRDGAVRTADDAATQAKARMTLLASRPLLGFIEVLGSPKVKPGELVKLDGIPAEHPVSALASGKVLRVRTVRHTLSMKAGFVTRMEF
jgi:phage protein D